MCGAAAALLADILCHRWTPGPQVAEGDQETVIVIRILSETGSQPHWPALSTSLHTLLPVDNIGSMLRDLRWWETQNMELQSPAASAMIISAKCPGTGAAGEREAWNVIKFYSRIIFIQIRVQSLMLALYCPEAGIGINNCKLSPQLFYFFILICNSCCCSIKLTDVHESLSPSSASERDLYSGGAQHVAIICDGRVARVAGPIPTLQYCPQH